MSKDDSSQLTRDIAPFGVRMPADLKERVSEAAKANSRSMNAEIVATLDEKYPAPQDVDLDAFLSHWLSRLPSSPAPDAIDAWCRDANKALGSSPWRVKVSADSDGTAVQFVRVIK